MCNKITTKFSKCGHEEVHDIPCNEMLDGAACSGKNEQADTEDEKKCPDCAYYDNALLQIATDANLAPHKPTGASAPAYTGPMMYHIRRFRWKHCGHIKDEWTDLECLDPEEVYLEEEQDFACYKCAEAHPSVLKQMKQEGKMDADDPWDLAIKDPTNHPKFGVKPSTPAAEASSAPSASSRRTQAPRSPPTEDESLYSLSPPPGTTSFYADDEPIEPPAPTHEPPRHSAPARGHQPRRGAGRSPAGLDPISEDEHDPVARAGGPVPVDDLSDTDEEADDMMRPSVLAMTSIAPPTFVSRMPTRGGPPPRRAHTHEDEADYDDGPEERLHDLPPPRWGSGASDDDEPAAEAEELTPEEQEEAKKLNLPAGFKVTRRLLERRREEAGLARMRLLIPEEQVTGPGGRKGGRK